jgi:hypothetical protein
MLKKTTTPIVEKFKGDGDLIVTGTKVEYRLFGILLYQKVLYMPAKYGMYHFENYQTRI